MRVKGLRRLLAWTLLLVFAAALFTVGIFLRRQGVDRAAGWLGVAGGLLACVPVVVSVLRRASAWIHGIGKFATITLDQAADDLRQALAKQWTLEDRRWRLNDPKPLPVRWAVTPAAEAAMAGVDWDDVGGDQRVRPRALAGEFGEIHALFTRLPSRRLVVLGQAGAGKSILALKLALDLLGDRAPAHQVPVLLQLASWDPDVSLHSWAAEQLVRDHGDLDALLPPGIDQRRVSLATALLTSGRLLLILDGFDEIPEPSRRKALAQINGLGAQVPLVLTSRTDAYQQAVDAVGRGLSRAAAIELAPIDVPTIKQYLAKATATRPERRWAAVFAQLDQAPTGPIAEALQTPLMVWLARTVYEFPDATPGELTDPIRFPSRIAVEHHLLDRFIPAVYAEERSFDGDRRRWDAARAEHYLRLLARRMQDRGARELAWWHLPSTLPRALLEVTVGLVAGLALGLAAYLTFGSPTGLGLGLAAGLVLGLLDTSKGTAQPRSKPPSRGTTTMLKALDWVVVARVTGLVVGFTVGLARAVDGGLAVGIADGATAALATGLVVGFLGRGRPEPTKVEFRIRANLGSFLDHLLAGLLFGLAFGLVLGFSVGLAIQPSIGLVTGLLAVGVGLAFGLVDGLNLWMGAPVDITRAVDPRSVLEADRRAAVARGIMVWIAVSVGAGLAVGSALGPVAGPVLGLTLGLAYGLADRLMGVTATAWGTFGIARALLAASNRLPWRLIDFLEDARLRGVLRQAGATYRFRHARLQQRLAAQDPNPDTDPAPGQDVAIAS